MRSFQKRFRMTLNRAMGIFGLGSQKPRSLRKRQLRMEPLEDRQLLTVTASIAASTASLVEKDQGQSTFTLSVADIPTGWVGEVDYTVTQTASQGNDYTASNSFLSNTSYGFGYGNTGCSCTITVRNDAAWENNETINVTITGGFACDQCGHRYDLAIGSASATVTIDDDDHWTIGVQAIDPQAAEPTDNGQHTDGGQFMVTRTGPAGMAMDETYGIDVSLSSGGTATAGVDYGSLASAVSFSGSTRCIALNVSVIDDDAQEVKETVVLNFTGNCSVGGGCGSSTYPTSPSSATVTIDDNDVVSPKPCVCQCPDDSGVSVGVNVPAGGVGVKAFDLAFGYYSHLASGQETVTAFSHLDLTKGSATLQKVEAKLTTFGSSSPNTTIWFDAAGASGSEGYTFALPADVSSLSSGAYPWTVQLVEHYSDSTTQTISRTGRQDVINIEESPFGPGFADCELTRLVPDGSDVLMMRGGMQRFMSYGGGWMADTTNDTSDYSLTGNWYSGFTLTAKEGTVDHFNTSGAITSTVDPVGNTTSYTYDGSGRPSTIVTTEGTTTFAYNAGTGLLSTVTRPDGVVLTVNHNGSGQVSSIAMPDPDGAGPLSAPEATFEYDGNEMLSSVTYPGGAEETYEYDHARRLKTITRADGTEENYVSLSSAALVDTSGGVGFQGNPAALRARDDLEVSSTIGGVTTTAEADRWGFASDAVDGEGNATQYVRDAAGKVVEMIEPDPDGAGPLESAVTSYEYDLRGNLTKITLPDETTREWQYDATWNVPTQYTDQRGIVTLYEIDPGTGLVLTSRVVVGQIDGQGNSETDDVVTEFTYTTSGNGVPVGLVETLTDANGVVTTYAYNAHGKVTGVTYADGTAQEASVSRTYDATTGNLLTETDELGRQTDFGYDSIGRLTSKTLPDPDGAGPLSRPVYEFAYDAAGSLASETDPLDNVTSYQYDLRGRLVKTTQPDPDGAGPLASPVTVSFYDTAGRLAGQLDPLGRATTYAYDDDGRQTAVYRGSVLDDGQDGYDEVSGTWSDGSEGFNDASRTAATVTGTATAEATWTFGNLLAGRQYDVLVTWHADTNNAADAPFAVYADDTSGMPLSTAQIDQTADPSASGVWTTIAGVNFRSLGGFTTTGTTLVVQLKNNSANAGKSAVADAIYLRLAAAVSQTSYDAAGRASSTTDALGNVTAFEYDSMDRQTKVTQPDPDDAGPLAAPEIEYVYNSLGQLYQVIDALDRVTTYEYDSLGRTSKVTQPDPDGAGAQLAPWTAYTYDKMDNVLTETDRLGHGMTYVYNNRGRVTSHTDAEDATTSFTYDLKGNRLTLTDPDENTTAWEYDDLDRAIQETNELNDSRYFVYNAAGHLTRQVDRLGRVRQFVYDHLGRSTAEIWYNNTTDADGDTNRQRAISFTYDADGEMLSADDPDASYTYTYDSLGNVVKIVQSIAGLTPAVTLTQAYDAAGRRTQLATRVNGTNDFVNDYTFDALGRTRQIDQHGVTGGKDVAENRVDFEYDAASQPTTLTRYADLTGTDLVAATDYVFDADGRLTDLTHYRGATTFADYGYSFDAGSGMTQFVSSADGTADYTNDGSGQLTGADYDYQTDESYVYDANGNRTNGGYTVSANNRMTSDGTYHYLYDAEGNRTARFVDTNDNGLLDSGDTDITEYAWDQRDRLTSVRHRASYGAAADWVVTYAYDFANRWVAKELDSDGDETPEFRQVFAYDGNQIIFDFHREGSQDLTIGHLRGRNLWGRAVDQILAEEAVDGGTADLVLWTLTDHQNSVRDEARYDPNTDTTTIVNHVVFDAFGNVTDQSSPAVASLFLYTARPFDADTGLQNNLNRWYDPRAGRWLAEDPIGFRAGANIYVYVGNSPIRGSDPSGLAEKCGECHDPNGADETIEWIKLLKEGREIAEAMKHNPDLFTKSGFFGFLSAKLTQGVAGTAQALDLFTRPGSHCNTWLIQTLQALKSACNGNNSGCASIGADPPGPNKQSTANDCGVDIANAGGGLWGLRMHVAFSDFSQSLVTKCFARAARGGG